jgi:hypothetical protein
MKEEDRAAIKVDYSDHNTAAQVFHNVAKHCMSGTDGPNLLMHAGLERHTPDLPTWVPDWSTTHRTPFVTGIYSACKNLYRPIPMLPGGRKIKPLGVKVDVLASTGIPMSHLDGTLQLNSDRGGSGTPTTYSVVLSAAIMCERARGVHPRYPLRHQDWSDVVWRTCSMDRSWAGDRLAAQDRRSWAAFMQRHGLGDDIIEAVKEDESGQCVADSSTRHLDDPALREAAMPFEIVVLDAQRGRVLGFTRGGLFGSFPSTAQPGDVVVVLFGGWVPFLLRPVGDDEYELVGGCYLHGIMDGEWIDAAVRSEQRELFQEFVIR